MKNNKQFIEMLKKHTTIDIEFINTFFSKFNIGEDLSFHILDKDVAIYLKISLQTLRDRLNNKFSKTKLYIENVDFIKNKNKKTSVVIYYLNYTCFERIAMNGYTKQAELVRIYFSELRKFITYNQNIFSQSLVKKEMLRDYANFESIYFFAVDERKMDFKIGSTSNIIKRLRSYNTGRINEVDLKFYVIVKNMKIIEKCIREKLNKNQVIDGREIYRIEPTKIKKVINDCFCKNITLKEQKDLADELGDLMKLYSYTKDKVNIKPFIIIGKNI